MCCGVLLLMMMMITLNGWWLSLVGRDRGCAQCPRHLHRDTCRLKLHVLPSVDSKTTHPTTCNVPCAAAATAAAGVIAAAPPFCRYGQTPSWFVLFRSQKAAAIASSCNILPMNQDLFQVCSTMCVCVWFCIVQLGGKRGVSRGWLRLCGFSLWSVCNCPRGVVHARNQAAPSPDTHTHTLCPLLSSPSPLSPNINQSTHPALIQVHPAPGPEEVNWESLWFNHRQRQIRAFATTPFAILVVGAPVSLLTSAISSLSGTFCSAVKWDVYCNSTSLIGKILKGLVTGFLPSLLIILWQVIVWRGV